MKVFRHLDLLYSPWKVGKFFEKRTPPCFEGVRVAKSIIPLSDLFGTPEVTLVVCSVRDGRKQKGMSKLQKQRDRV